MGAGVVSLLWSEFRAYVTWDDIDISLEFYNRMILVLFV